MNPSETAKVKADLVFWRIKGTGPCKVEMRGTALPKDRGQAVAAIGGEKLVQNF